MTIGFTVPRAGHVRLSVLDVQGRLVAILVDEIRRAGRSRATWAGGSFRAHAPGLYLLHLESEGVSAVGRALVVP